MDWLLFNKNNINKANKEECCDDDFVFSIIIYLCVFFVFVLIFLIKGTFFFLNAFFVRSLLNLSINYRKESEVVNFGKEKT